MFNFLNLDKILVRGRKLRGLILVESSLCDAVSELLVDDGLLRKTVSEWVYCVLMIAIIVVGKFCEG